MKESVDIPLGSATIPGLKYESSKNFLNHSQQQDKDIAFLGSGHRNWMHSKYNSRLSREILQTLLLSQGENSNEYVEKLIEENISYRDLASLTETDLELMDFKNSKQREELLAIFKMLPNQDPSYDDICKMPEAKKYNTEIFNNASAHLTTMRSALSSANYKLQLMPPNDVIVGERNFASRFVLEALNELHGVTADVEKELKEIETIMLDEHIKTKQKDNSVGLSCLLTTALIGIAFSVWYFKLKK